MYNDLVMNFGVAPTRIARHREIASQRRAVRAFKPSLMSRTSCLAGNRCMQPTVTTRVADVSAARVSPSSCKYEGKATRWFEAGRMVLAARSLCENLAHFVIQQPTDPLGTASPERMVRRNAMFSLMSTWRDAQLVQYGYRITGLFISSCAACAVNARSGDSQVWATEAGGTKPRRNIADCPGLCGITGRFARTPCDSTTDGSARHGKP